MKKSVAIEKLLTSYSSTNNEPSKAKDTLPEPTGLIGKM